MPSIINATTTNGVAISPDNSGSLQLATNNGTTAVTIDTSQNVGVGTTSPNGLLSVYGSGRLATFRNSTTGSGSSDGSYIALNGNDLQISNGESANMIFYTADTERMRIDSSGNVGIGTTSSGNKFEVAGSGMFSGAVTTNTTGTHISYQSGNSQIGAWGPDTSTNGTLVFFSARSNGVNGLERMRIDSSGRLLVGCTNEPNASINGFKADVAYTIIASSGQIPFYVNRNTNTGEIQQLRYNNGAVGNISTNGSNCTFNSTSDYRLKENIVPMTGALDKVAQLKPVTYTWKKDGQDGEGFIAHELAEVCPEAVTGEKDAVDEEGKPIYQAIDQSVLVATLTAAIQELKAELDTVKAELNTLKNPPVEGTE